LSKRAIGRWVFKGVLRLIGFGPSVAWARQRVARKSPRLRLAKFSSIKAIKRSRQ